MTAGLFEWPPACIFEIVGPVPTAPSLSSPHPETPASRPSQPALPAKARAFISFVSLLGAVVLAGAVAGWESHDLLRFAGFLAIAVLSAGLVVVPGATSSLSITFLFVLFGAQQLSVPETVVLACAAALVQSFCHQSSRPGFQQVVFQVATATSAAGAAAFLYRLVAAPGAQTDQVIGLALATIIVFLLNTVPNAVVISLAEEAPIFPVWRECYLWSFTYYLGGAAVAQVASIACNMVGWPTVLLTGPVLYLIFRSYRLYVGRLDNERQHSEDVSALHLRTIEALAMAIEAKDDTTHDHLARVQVYARELGKELGLSEDEQEALRAASILHDIGKLAVPEHIISKPGRLTPEEFEKMKIHPVVGAEILERVKFPYPVVPIVRAHHEKWDGSGYPYGLKGEAIPIGARILAAVDCLDALSTDRQYRRALPLDEAMRIVEKDAGTHFDPRIVDLLSKRYVQLEKMAKSLHHTEPLKLSKDVKFERGEAPAAGFESAPVAASTASVAQHTDFLSSIAAARQEVQALFEISQELGNSLSMTETLTVLGVRLRGIVPHHSMVIWVCREGKLSPEYASGDDFRLFSSLQIPVGQGLSGWVAENRKTILNGNPSVESGYLNDPTKFSTLRSALAVPLEGMTGIVGVLALYHAERDAFTKDHLRVLLAVSSKVALSVENALRFRQSEASSASDALTGLPNARALFVHLDGELARSRRTDQPLAVLTLDLDNFKSINERFGQVEGNRVLRAVGLALKSVCREYDTVARMGGDEYVMVLSGPRPGEMEGKLEQIRSAIGYACRDLYVDGQLTVSIGVAHYPQDGQYAEELLAESDQRMFAEKRIHRERAAGVPRNPSTDLSRLRATVLQ